MFTWIVFMICEFSRNFVIRSNWIIIPFIFDWIELARNKKKKIYWLSTLSTSTMDFNWKIVDSIINFGFIIMLKNTTSFKVFSLKKNKIVRTHFEQFTSVFAWKSISLSRIIGPKKKIFHYWFVLFEIRFSFFLSHGLLISSFMSFFNCLKK